MVLNVFLLCMLSGMKCVIWIVLSVLMLCLLPGIKCVIYMVISVYLLCILAGTSGWWRRIWFEYGLTAHRLTWAISVLVMKKKEKQTLVQGMPLPTPPLVASDRLPEAAVLHQARACVLGFNFSQTKTVSMHFCNLRKLHHEPTHTFNGLAIPVVQEHNFSRTQFFWGYIWQQVVIYTPYQIFKGQMPKSIKFTKSCIPVWLGCW